MAVDEQRQRQLVGDRQRHDLLVVLDRAVEPLDHRLAQRGRLVVVEVVGALERRQLRRPQDLVDPRASDAGDHALVAQHAVQRPCALVGEQLAQVRRVGPRLGPERRQRVVVLELGARSSFTHAAWRVPNSRSRSSRSSPSMRTSSRDVRSRSPACLS